MNQKRKMKKALIYIFGFLLLVGCSSNVGPERGAQGNNGYIGLSYFPAFITKNDDYFITRITTYIPEVDVNSYTLTVKGNGEEVQTFSYNDLLLLPMVEYPLTVECIGNSANGSLVSTANWKGFNIYDFLTGLGMSDNIGGVKYYGDDGYFASHTLDQIKDENVIGALFMNDEAIPALHGFPLRILIPGYYGVKQPAWVTSIEIIPKKDIGSIFNDYWAMRTWDVSPSMPADCNIFFPQGDQSFQIGDTLVIGGAAFGGTRIEKVEFLSDTTLGWQETEIVQATDEDHVWIFWYKEIIFSESAEYTIYFRATDIFGNVQEQTDPDILDGNSRMPHINVTVN